MTFAPFVHLRLHTQYSLSEGALRVKQVVGKLADMNMPAAAITDTNNMFGTLEFSDVCFGSGIQPIMGVQLSVARPEKSTELSKDNRPPEPDKLVFLAKDEAGWHNLMRLNSHAFLYTEPGLTPYVTWDVLAEHTEGVIALSGGLDGPVGRQLVSSQKDHAVETLTRFKTLYGDRAYVEVQRHNTPDEIRIEDTLLDLAYDLDIPLVATNDCFFLDEDMYLPQDALMCIAEGTYVGVEDRRRLTPEHRLKTAEEMRALFADLPEATDNTLVIAERCAFRSPKRDPILPRAFDGDESETDTLNRMAREGLEKRMEQAVYTPHMSAEERAAKHKEYFDRLEFELKIIDNMGFPGYFLIVADFIQWSKDNDIPVGPGRGSGAGSAVAWALTITDLDPIRFGLLFERFLNPERVSMPDFDIDFCQDKREQTIKYVQDKYGKDKVAQIITFGQLKSKAAMRDVGRVLQMSFGHVDKLCKMIPMDGVNPVPIKKARELEPRLEEAARDEEVVAQLLETAESIEGLYRHASTHAAGVVIGDRPLDELVPLYRDPKSDMPVTQYNMKFVEQAGLVKFDFLGLKTLTVLDQAVDFVKRKRGVDIDLSTVPLDDPKTFELLGRGDTVAVFQLESAGMRDVLRKMKPDSFEDIIAIVSLYRPGPMDNIPSYIARKKGEETPDYLHKSIEHILKETYGIMIYQEQVMQIAQEMAGYSLGEADLLRRAMGKKIAEEMDKQRVRFTEGSIERGIPEKKAKEVFDLMAKFASYGFNKSHAAAYALVAYHTAYLKANFPAEFMAASMNLDLANTDKLNIFKQDLEKAGFDVRPPNVNKSLAGFEVELDTDDTTERGAIRYALGAVKGIGFEAMKEMVAERDANSAFSDMADFASRINPKGINRRQLETLARAGAFDDLDINRRKVFEGAETILRWAQAEAEQRDSNQVSLFGGDDMQASQKAAFRLDDVPRWISHAQLQEEYGAIGFFISAHPLDVYEEALKRLDVMPLRDLPRSFAGGRNKFKVAGTVISRQDRRTKEGKAFCRISLSDPSGTFEVAFFSEGFIAARDIAEVGAQVYLTVTARGEDAEDIRLMGDTCRRLEDIVASAEARMTIDLSSEVSLPAIQDYLAGIKGGRGRVTITTAPSDTGFAAKIDLPGAYQVTPAIAEAIDVLPGVDKCEAV